jgi:hypothetical protein
MSRTASAIANSVLDPTEAIVGYNGGRLSTSGGVASSAVLAFQGTIGPYIEVATRRVNITSPLECQFTDNLVLANGDPDAVGASDLTLYYAFVSYNGFLRLSETAPSFSNEAVGLYLSDTPGGRLWRFVGWVRTGVGVFEDSPTRRCIINAENRKPRPIFYCPGYNNNNAQTTYSHTSATWAPLNGVATPVVVIAGGTVVGELDVSLSASCSAVGAGGATIGILASGFSNERAAATLPGAGVNHSASCRLLPIIDGPSVITLEPQAVSSAASTFIADAARSGAAADPAVTVLTGWVLG